jgi:hypothetical protein
MSDNPTSNLPIPDPNDQTQTQSPLLEADPRSIDELMARIDENLVKGMPREIKWEDVEALSAYLRSQRKLFVQLQQQNIKPSRSKLKKSPRDLSEALKNLEY